jgi:hypothetical protein
MHHYRDIIEGVGRDVPIETLPGGGKQSVAPARLDLIDGEAIIELGKVLQGGAKDHGEENWRLIPVRSHLNKALIHIFAWIAGDRQDDHLEHAFCRLMFAVSVNKKDRSKDAVLDNS